MKNTHCPAEELLQELIRSRGLDYLREGNGKFFVNAFAEMGGEKQDVTLLRYLTQCGGHGDLLEAATLSPAMQRACYSQTVQKLCDKTLIPKAMANRICAAFWQAVYNTQPPVAAPVPPTPQLEKTAEELFREAQNSQDQTQKADLLRQAAHKGHPEAMLHLGFAYGYGNGISKDPGEAFRWFRQAADQGLAPAQDRLAYCYDKGFGVERDLDQAIAWCRKANSQNFPDAARHLRQLEEKKRQEAPDISGNRPEFDIVNGALLKYNGTAAKVTVPGGVTRIGAKAFFGNDSIRSVKLPYGLIGLGTEAFVGCRNLQKITISGSVIAVNLDVFAGCRKLKKITLQSGVQKLIFGDHLDQLGSVTIGVPDSVSSVTWSPMPDSQRAERMKHPKGILASQRWTDLLQDFFSQNSDFRSGKARRMGVKQVAIAFACLCILAGVIIALSGIGGSSEKEKVVYTDWSNIDLGETVQQMIAVGTEDIYTCMDGSTLEMYFDEDDLERCRIYKNKDGNVEFLFTAEYNADGDLLKHLTYDAAGTIIRTDRYYYNSDHNWIEHDIILENDVPAEITTRTFSSEGDLLHSETKTGNDTVIDLTNWEYDGEGNAHSITNYMDGTSEESQEIFDEDGNKVNSVYYSLDKEGNTTSKREYQFDKNGIQTATYYYDADDQITGWTEWFYDDVGNLIKAAEFLPDGTSDGYKVFSYDQQGREILQKRYDENGVLSEEYTPIYGPHDIEIGQTVLKYGDNLISTKSESAESIIGTSVIGLFQSRGGDSYSDEITFYDTMGRYFRNQEYDEEGRLCSEYTALNDSLGNDIGYTHLYRVYDEEGRLTYDSYCEYDADGNALAGGTTSTYYHSDGNYTITEYDSENNMLSRKVYNASGKLLSEE